MPEFFCLEQLIRPLYSYCPLFIYLFTPTRYKLIQMYFGPIIGVDDSLLRVTRRHTTVTTVRHVLALFRGVSHNF